MAADQIFARCGARTQILALLAAIALSCAPVAFAAEEDLSLIHI